MKARECGPAAGRIVWAGTRRAKLRPGASPAGDALKDRDHQPRETRGRGSNREALFAVLVTVACLLPFIGKAFHIDDPMFLWAAE